MASQKKEKVISVREHPRNVPITQKNPQGITIVDKHLRRLYGTYLNSQEIKTVVKNYPRIGLVFPTPRDLNFKKVGNLYDETIAIWTDYFNKKFKLKREPTHEELILEYKGLLKSKTLYKDNALISYRKNYNDLKKK